MPSALRVLFIASAYPRFEGDVITPWLGATIVHLRGVGVEVEVLAPAYHALPSHLVQGVRVHRFRYAPTSWEMLSHDNPIPAQLAARPLRLALVPGYVAACSIAATRLAQHGRFDVLHAFWPLPHAVPGLIARRIARIPLVSTFFGAELHWLGRKPWARAAVRTIVRASDAVTVISTHTGRQLRAIVPGATADVIPFGAAMLTPKHSAPATETSGLPGEFLFVGRLVPRKGVDVLLRALALIDDARYRLTIVGDGVERAALEALAASLHITHRLTFTGFLPAEQLDAQLRSCTALILPAVTDDIAGTEGLGVVVIEALTFARPVIASDVGGIPDVVEHERTGLLVAAGSSDALAGAMRRIFENPAFARMLGECGRTHVRERFSWPVITGALRRVYDRVVATHSA